MPRRSISHVVYAALVALVAVVLTSAAAVGFAVVGCSPVVRPQGCASDDECGRGERCEDGACTATTCGTLRDAPRCVDNVLEVCRAAGDEDERVEQIDCGALAAVCVDGTCAGIATGAPCDDERLCAAGLTCEDQGPEGRLCALPSGARCTRFDDDGDLVVDPCAGAGSGCLYDDLKSTYTCTQATLTCARPDPASAFAPQCAGGTLVIDCVHGDQPYGFPCDFFDGTCVTDACRDVRKGSPCDDAQLLCAADATCTQAPSGDRYCAVADGESCFVEVRDDAVIVAPCEAPGSGCMFSATSHYFGGYICRAGTGSCAESPTGNEPSSCLGNVLQTTCLYGGMIAGVDCASYGGGCAVDVCTDLRAWAPCGDGFECQDALVCGTDTTVGQVCEARTGQECFADLGFGGEFLPCAGTGAACVFDGTGDFCRAGLPFCDDVTENLCADARYLFTDCIFGQPRALDCQALGGTCTTDRCQGVDTGNICGGGVFTCEAGKTCNGENVDAGTFGTCS